MARGEARVAGQPPLTPAQRQAAARARRRAREFAVAAGANAAEIPVVAFLRAVMTRTDGLGARAQAADIRIGLEAADLLSKFDAVPSEHRMASALARLLSMAPSETTLGPDERQTRALEAVSWAMDLLVRGVAGSMDLRAGLAACERLLDNRPKVDAHAVMIYMAMILSGASQQVPAHLLVGEPEGGDDYLPESWLVR